MTAPTCSRPGCNNPLPHNRPRFCSDRCCDYTAKREHRLRASANGTRCTCGGHKDAAAPKCHDCTAKPAKQPKPAPAPKRRGTIANVKRPAAPCKADKNGRHGCQCQACIDAAIEQIVKNQAGGGDAFRERNPGKTGTAIHCKVVG